MTEGREILVENSLSSDQTSDQEAEYWPEAEDDLNISEETKEVFLKLKEEMLKVEDTFKALEELGKRLKLKIQELENATNELRNSQEKISLALLALELKVQAYKNEYWDCVNGVGELENGSTNSQDTKSSGVQSTNTATDDFKQQP